MAENATEQFKENVREFVRVDNECSTLSKSLSGLRKRKRELEDSIQNFMRGNNVETCNINDGTLSTGTSKRQESINKDYIREKLTAYFQGDVVKAEEIVQYLLAHRSVKHKEVLKRTKRRRMMDDEEEDETSEEEEASVTSAVAN